MKLLITSVGSLVGKNILDVLEYPPLSRRALLQVIGTNSAPEAANNFRCDRCYRVPETAEPGFGERMEEILGRELPDLILCGRDADTLALSELKALHPTLPGTLPVGKPRGTLLGLDKWQTWQFSLKHGLPFGESFMLREPADAGALEAFCARVGYPLVAKPARGFASRGVHFIRDARDARILAERAGYLFQEYLGDPRDIEGYFASFNGPPPLHAQPPETGHYSSQTLITPSGDITPAFVMYIQLEYGNAVASRRVMDPTLDALTGAYARALAAEGVVGPVNIAFRRDRHGSWKVLEINLRNTGSTFARFLMGLDELYLIARHFVPSASFPERCPAKPDLCDQITKHVTASPIPKEPAAVLKSSGIWSSAIA
jgi:hypothetical protein